MTRRRYGRLLVGVDGSDAAGAAVSFAIWLAGTAGAVGSTGIGLLRGRLLGSVSSRVVDHARCSVMVFHDGQASSPADVASVVGGIDASPGAAAAIATGRRLAGALDAKLVLVLAYQSSTALAPPATEPLHRTP